MKWLVLRLISFYQRFLSLDSGWLGRIMPHRGRICRFEPSCSEYAAEAIERWGIGRGSWLAIQRISHCHPWGGSGWDPVPKQK